MGGVDKQLRTVGGVPVLARTVAAFEECDDVGAVVLVVNPDNMAGAAGMRAEFGWTKVRAMVPGGERRQDSVGAGLAAVKKLAREDGRSPFEWVAVHDGARPLVTPELISQGLEAARQHGAAIAAVPATDTVKRVDASGVITDTLDRSSLWLAQTPQVFRTSLLINAYDTLAQRGDGVDVTDDARIVELSGHPVRVYEGDPTNIKITTPLDLWVAEAIIRARSTGAWN
jgi:2-C-methyl-D-erythritol 4-phosphate cytidylyltransferase